MTIQDIVQKIGKPEQVIKIRAKDSQKEVEVSSYLLRKSLLFVDSISAENITLTVDEKAFEGIKQYYNL